MNAIVEDTIGLDRLSELALALSFEDRVRLLDSLHNSLQSHEEAEIEKAWLKESIRRLNEIRSGAVEPIDADVVFAEARARLRR